MEIDRGHIYSSSDDFFLLNGSVVMMLTADAAISVCEKAVQHGLVVVRIEGGIWHFPGFEARLDCIWDGVDPPVDAHTAKKNNQAAVEFIRSESQIHDVFIITAPPLTAPLLLDSVVTRF